jgi:hypothetical protein
VSSFTRSAASPACVEWCWFVCHVADHSIGRTHIVESGLVTVLASKVGGCAQPALGGLFVRVLILLKSVKGTFNNVSYPCTANNNIVRPYEAI